MNYPTKELIESASHVQLAIWYRFLPSPIRAEVALLNLIMSRFESLGGWNPGLSKRVGWEGGHV